MYSASGPDDSTYWTRSRVASQPSDPVLFHSIDLALGVICLLHILVTWKWYRVPWAPPRAFGCAFSVCVIAQFLPSLICDLRSCSLEAHTIIDNLLGRGLLSPFVKMADMYLSLERYRALCTAEAVINNRASDAGDEFTSSTSVSYRERALQILLLFLALTASFASWPFHVVIPFFAQTNAEPYISLQNLIAGVVEVRSYFDTACN